MCLNKVQDRNNILTFGWADDKQTSEQASCIHQCIIISDLTRVKIKVNVNNGNLPQLEMCVLDCFLFACL